jgi:CspA family cold shock protein
VQGTVKWFDDEKGFGFIGPRGGAKDVFVHYTGIVGAGTGRRTLKQHDKVAFEMGESDKGPQAVEVTVIPQFDEVESDALPAS